MKNIELFRTKIQKLKSYYDSDSSADLLQYGITQSYYEDIVKASKLISEFSKKYLRTNSVYLSIKKRVDGFEPDDMELYILIDIMRCYDGLDHSTSFTTPEGIALLVIISELYSVGNIHQYEDLKNVNYSTISITDLTPIIAECSYELGSQYSLFISEILETENPSVDKLYRLIIYNLCHKIAMADGEISLSEKEWLEEIARLNDDDITNDIDVSLFK